MRAPTPLTLWAMWALLSPAAGANDLSLGLTAPAQQKTVLRYGGLFQAGARQTNVSASAPVYRTERDAVSLSARYNWLDFFPDPSRIPALRDIQFGASFTHEISERKLWSVSGSFGSASDRPFQDSSVGTISATAMYAFPGSETSSWLLLLSYSNNRPILNGFPLPGFAYTHAPSRFFRGTFGVPFASIYWQFVDRWSLTLFTIAPWVAKAQVAYSIAGPLQVFSGIDFSQSTYLELGRANPEERLYYDEKKAFVGARSPLSSVFFGELEAGRAFGRRVFSARSYRLRPAEAIDLDASWYVRTGLTAMF